MPPRGGIQRRPLQRSRDRRTRCDGRQYKAILSDIHMPRITGTQMLEVIRSYGSTFPVVLMTGAPSIDTAQAAWSSGAVHYLTSQ